jgi:SAM-dependent methyltransferase
VHGYTSSSYGDAFADVYDDWYGGVSDIDASVALLADITPADGRVLELGVGTGRLALPLSALRRVVGVDASRRMLDVLEARRTADHAIEVVRGDMVDDLPDGPFDTVFVAYNTFFNLLTEARQRACMSAVSDRLRTGGRFVIEAFVPNPDAQPRQAVTVRSLTVDTVVLSVLVTQHGEQRAEGHFVELSEAGGVRLRPWSIRWATPTELDEMATAAGLRLDHRWADVTRVAFADHHDRHVSVYVK